MHGVIARVAPRGAGADATFELEITLDPGEASLALARGASVEVRLAGTREPVALRLVHALRSLATPGA